jgi:hypothetical protein
MLGLVLVLPLMFASPETITFSEPEATESVNVVTKLTLCTDKDSGEFGYCFTVTANLMEVTLFVVDGSPVSLKMWNGVITYTIWER